MTRLPRISTGERVLFMIGLLLLGSVIAELVVLLVLVPEIGMPALQGLGAEIVTGREGGVPVGLNAGVPAILMWQLSWSQDLAGAFLVYPLFLHLLHVQDRNEARLRDRMMALWYQRDAGLAPRAVGLRILVYRLGFALMRRVDRLQAASLRHEKKVRRWGRAGIFVFMLIPFLVNGPLIAFILGRLIGIRTRLLVAPIVVATMVTAALWVAFFDTMLSIVNAIDPRFGTYVAVGAVVIVVGLAAWDVLRERGAVPIDDSEE